MKRDSVVKDLVTFRERCEAINPATGGRGDRRKHFTRNFSEIQGQQQRKNLFQEGKD